MKFDFQDMVIYEDNHLLVVNKPANLLSQEDNTKDPDLVSLAKLYLKAKYDKQGNVYVGLVHRLDRMTEGVMVLAKTSKAASRLSDDIRNKNWHKEYLCLVEGIIEKDGKLINYLDHINDSKKMQVIRFGKGQRAELEYFVKGHINGNTLLKINLLTGRHHQIRCQLSAFNHPIVGDLLYGDSKKKQDLMLACINLTIKHPTKDETLSFKALPKSKKWINILNIIKL